MLGGSRSASVYIYVMVIVDLAAGSDGGLCRCCFALAILELYCTRLLIAIYATVIVDFFLECSV
jgi:hypothetical protein